MPGFHLHLALAVVFGFHSYASSGTIILLAMRASLYDGCMLIAHINVQVKPGSVDAFLQATLANAREREGAGHRALRRATAGRRPHAFHFPGGLPDRRSDGPAQGNRALPD